MEKLGRYEIIEELGHGAMGAVYRASDPVMGREVALKTILAQAATGPQAAEYRERFMREAQAAARFLHPGIVAVYDISEHEGTLFLVMEFVAGRTLQAVLESGERLPLELTYELGAQLAEALDYAHRQGVVHRDIKPSNILITTDNRAKIADFGVAKIREVQMTTTGQLLGTPAFMAPEQFTGMPVDGRADLFALGVVLYWMATGDKPFTGDTLHAVSYKIVHTDPIPPRKLNPAIPREFEAVIRKCMEKDPAARYPSGEALARDLRALREGRTPAAALEAPPSDPGRTLVAGPPEVAPSPSTSGLGKTAAGMDAASLDTAETVAVIPARASGGVGSAVSHPPVRPPAAPTQQPVASSPGVPSATSPGTAAPLPAQPIAKQSNLRLALIALIVFLVVVGVSRVAKLLRTSQEAEPPQVTVTSPPAQAPSLAEQQASQLAQELVREFDRRAAEVEKKIAEAAKPAAPLEKSQPPSDSKVRLEIRARERATVVYRAKGQPTATFAMKEGEHITLEAEEQAQIFTDNPPGIDITLNGKPLPPLGDRRSPRQVVITPAGIDEKRSPDPWKDFETAMRELRKRSPGEHAGAPPLAEKPPMPPEVPAESHSMLGSAMMQRALQKNPQSARLTIASGGLPDFVSLVVRVDNQVLFRREGKPLSWEPGRGKIEPDDIKLVSFEEVRFLPPGTRQIDIYLIAPTRRLSAQKSLSDEFKPGQRRTLRIEMERAAPGPGAGPRSAAPRLHITLE